MSSRERARVVIAGGGFAALEAALALRALVDQRLQLTLIAPERQFFYRPAATVEAFDDAPARRYDLSAIAADLGATYYRAGLEAVASHNRSVRLSSGVRLGYDALILAIGARAVAGIPGAFTFRDQRDVPHFRGLLRELESGAVARVVFAVPSGRSWPLPLYELALLSAARARRLGVETEISLVSPEHEPLSVFGSDAARLMAGLLAERGVRFVGDSTATAVRRDRSLLLHTGGAIEADRVVAAPQLRAHRISGVPASWWGFVPTDSAGVVEGLVDVYAAGDMTTFPIKLGGLAAQQADRIAHTIAASLGAPVHELHRGLVLKARLVGGQRPLFVRAELDGQGRPAAASLVRTEFDAASASKVFGRYLTPYLETITPVPQSPRTAA